MLRHWRAARAKKEQLGGAFTKLRHGRDARPNITIKRALSKYATSQRKTLALTLSIVVLTDASDGVEHGSYNWRAMRIEPVPGKDMCIRTLQMPKCCLTPL
jgi:hypothetical protein